MSDIQTTETSEEIEVPIESDKKKKSKFAVKEEITEENCQFTERQILKFVKVRFPGHAKSYSFLIGKRNLIYGQKVMAMSDRGMAVGYINSFPYEIAFQKNLLPLRSINRVASDEDIQKEKEHYKKQKEIETTCQNLINKHNLDMNLTHVEFTQFGKKVVFYFVAPARVDFRGLVKDLVSDLKLRIELRQISVRDRAASQGALGPCGRELCCSSFLSKYGNVSIKMAKNQNLTLNYSKLNGVCGQLKCCLQYEDEVYTQKRKKLPNEGDFVLTIQGDSGKVRKLNILSEQFDLLTDKGKIKRYSFNQLDKIYKNNEYQFPKKFDHISDETNVVIGLDEVESRAAKQFERDMEKIKIRAKKFAHDTIINFADFLPERDRSQDIIEEVETQNLPEQSEKIEDNVDVPTEIPESSTPDKKVDSSEESDKKNYKGNRRWNNKNNNRKRFNKNHKKRTSEGNKNNPSK